MRGVYVERDEHNKTAILKIPKEKMIKAQFKPMGKAKERKYQPSVEKRKSGQYWIYIRYISNITIYNTIAIGARKANGNRYTDEYLLGRNKASTKILALYVYIHNVINLLNITTVTKRTKVEAQGLKDGNKAVKTLSGAIAQVRTFWGKGYKKAFAEIGITFDMLEYKKLEAIMQKDENGIIYTVEAVRIKDAEGNYIKDEKGHYKKEEKNIPVKVWTANKLFDCLKQSLNK